MSLFNIQSAQAAEVVREVRNAEVERIFPKYVRLTLEKLDRSISDAKGRYQEGKSYANAKPSMNWRVVKSADSVAEEEVVVFLKIGISKMEIAPGKKELRIPASALVEVLEEMRSLIEGIKADPDSEQAQQFHEEAVKQAKPKSAPKAEGMSGWEYDAESDSYLAV